MVRTPCPMLLAWRNWFFHTPGAHSCWRNARKPSPAWGNWIALLLLACRSPGGNNSIFHDLVDHDSLQLHHRPYGPTHLPPIRWGGGLKRAVAQRRENLKLHDTGAGAVALNPLGKWYGASAGDINRKSLNPPSEVPLPTPLGETIKDALRNGPHFVGSMVPPLF